MISSDYNWWEYLNENFFTFSAFDDAISNFWETHSSFFAKQLNTRVINGRWHCFFLFFHLNLYMYNMKRDWIYVAVWKSTSLNTIFFVKGQKVIPNNGRVQMFMIPNVDVSVGMCNIYLLVQRHLLFLLLQLLLFICC